MTAIRITDALCLLADGHGWRAERRTMDIRGGRILALHASAPPDTDADTVIDGRGMLAFPGVVNAHNHSPDNLLRGSVPQLPLELWSLHSAAGRTRLGPRGSYIAAALGGIEMLRQGVTAVLDHVRVSPDIDIACLDAVAQAYTDIGMRAVIAPIVADRSVAETLPLSPKDLAGHEASAWGRFRPMPAADQIAVVREFARNWHGRGIIRVAVGPSAPQRCSDGLLDAAADLSEAMDLILHMHLLETRAQRAIGRLIHAPGSLRHLAARGLLGPRTTFAHAVWLDPGDVDLLGESGSAVVHNPVSNARLGSGTCDLPALLAAGVRIGLGTDSACCNDSNDLLETAKWASLVHTSGNDRTRWIDAAQAFRLATFGGADVIGLEEKVRGIAVGSAADVVLCTLDSVPFVPLHDPVRQLVLAQGSRSVRHVIVAGNHLVDDGRVTRMDEQAIWQEAADIARSRSTETRTDTEDAMRMAGPIEAMYRRLEKEERQT